MCILQFGLSRTGLICQPYKYTSHFSLRYFLKALCYPRLRYSLFLVLEPLCSCSWPSSFALLHVSSSWSSKLFHHLRLRFSKRSHMVIRHLVIVICQRLQFERYCANMLGLGCKPFSLTTAIVDKYKDKYSTNMLGLGFKPFCGFVTLFLTHILFPCLSVHRFEVLQAFGYPVDLLAGRGERRWR